ncbi:bifunctional diguanylate cyclase/phosphohydrolase [Sutcliffiella deserti]|uniref:bifunctional diguanylate cyclase/phosphohydrolase n=1 Tax=Sutcliffiella deserti TaxID=2875501 RepID=UPI001CBAE35A|nr:diguanylate cyclase [Sutcliffiella deserti]
MYNISKEWLQKIYILLICIIGILSFSFNSSFQVVALDEWVLLYTLVGAIIFLNYFIIVLPPQGNSLSMDSAIYLACLFLYGVEFTLLVLLISNSIFIIFLRRNAWWKHLFNFSIYSIMLSCAYYVYTISGGIVGDINLQYVLPFVLSLTTYFILNILLIWFYFYILQPPSVINIFQELVRRDALKESVVSYVSTLLLALVLTLLMKTDIYFGLFLFILLSVLLSFAFTKFFNLFKELEERANKDFLTGLYNHGYFKLKLDETYKKHDESETFSVALLDIDDFKKYNDQNGHLQGDEFLRFMGQFLINKTQTTPYIPARYGGEEFAILFPGVSKQEASAFLSKIRKDFNDTHYKGADELPLKCLSFSAGVAEYEAGTYNSTELLNKADKALYYAKAQGKNNVQVYYEEADVYQNDLYLVKEIENLEQQLQIFLPKDVYTYQHSKRVFRYAMDFSKKLELSDHEKQNLILGALIHDIGKVEIPRDIINKKGKLDPHEWEIMKKHVLWGKEIVSTTKKYEELLPLVELHHERYDGKGYPHGLKGDNIPKLARILCVIDSFDAMTTERPYQPTKTFPEAFEELRRCSGQQFDERYVEPFIEVIKENFPTLTLKDRVENKAE